MKLLWKEAKDWRQHWKLSKFLQALFLGLAASIFDLATDFHFARSVEEDCGYGGNEVFNFSSPCGSVHFKNVERVTYTFIASPGVLLGFATVHNIYCEGADRKVLEATCSGLLPMFVEHFSPRPGSRPLPWDVRGRNPQQEVLYHCIAIMGRSLRLYFPSSDL